MIGRYIDTSFFDNNFIYVEKGWVNKKKAPETELVRIFISFVSVRSFYPEI